MIMKRLILGAILAIPLLGACTSQDAIYRPYYEQAYRINYPQKATHLKGDPGYLRARLMWDIPVSPTCTDAVIYWNNNNDSLKISLLDPAYRNDTSICVTIPGLQELDYNFDVYVLDKEGSRSLPSQILVSPKGPSYMSGLGGRDVTNAVISEVNNSIQVIWSGGSKYSPYSEFRYTAVNKEQKTIRVDPSVDRLSIEDLNPGAEGGYDYRSIFVTEECLDTLYSEWIHGEWYKDPDYANTVDEGTECLTFRLRKGAEMSVDPGNPYQFSLDCTTNAPSLYVNELISEIAGPVLVFQYKQTLPSGDTRVLWVDAGGTYSGQRSSYLDFSGLVSGSDQWNVAVIDLSSMMSEYRWVGKAGDWSLLNISTTQGNQVTIRNVHFRAKRDGE